MADAFVSAECPRCDYAVSIPLKGTLTGEERAAMKAAIGVVDWHAAYF